MMHLGRLKSSLQHDWLSNFAAIRSHKERPAEPEGFLTTRNTTRSSKQVPTDACSEGGPCARLVVVGSFLALTGGLGLMNSIGVYQAWLAEHQLRQVDEGQRGWIFGLYNFMAFFCGIQVGPIFDMYGPTCLMMTSLALYAAVYAALGFCYLYWHFLVVIGIVAGAATSIIFVVPVATIGQYYHTKRGTATGLAMSGGSLGGIMFPLIFQDLSEQLGFAWTTRIVGLITVCLLGFGCLTVRSQAHKGRKQLRQTIFPDAGILLDGKVFLLTIGVFFIEWGFFIGLEYISSYSLAAGIERQVSYLMIVFLNAGSFPGRWLPGILADRFGRLNTLTAATLLCAISVLALWLPAKGRTSITIAFAVMFGFASGSNISLVPVCVGEFCPTENYGKYYTTVYTVVSFGALTGVPIATQILKYSNGDYTGLILFAGVSYLAGMICFFAVIWINRRNTAQLRSQ